MKIKYYSEGPDISRGNPFAAGIDLPFYDPELPESVTLDPGKRVMLKTGVHMEIPYGYYGDVDTRSSTSKLLLILLCHTIDCDYRGNIRLVLFNLGDEPITVPQGATLCQIIIKKYEDCEVERVTSLSDLSPTERGQNGFGHTGNNITQG